VNENSLSLFEMLQVVVLATVQHRATLASLLTRFSLGVCRLEMFQIVSRCAASVVAMCDAAPVVLQRRPGGVVCLISFLRGPGIRSGHFPQSLLTACYKRTKKDQCAEISYTCLEVE
jgi:hypothetical protein